MMKRPFSDGSGNLAKRRKTNAANGPNYLQKPRNLRKNFEIMYKGLYGMDSNSALFLNKLSKLHKTAMVRSSASAASNRMQLQNFKPTRNRKSQVARARIDRLESTVIGLKHQISDIFQNVSHPYQAMWQKAKRKKAGGELIYSGDSVTFEFMKSISVKPIGKKVSYEIFVCGLDCSSETIVYMDYFGSFVHIFDANLKYNNVMEYWVPKLKSIDKIVMIVRGHVSEETYAKEYKLWGTKVIGTWVETNSDMDFKANFGLHDLYLLKCDAPPEISFSDVQNELKINRRNRESFDEQAFAILRFETSNEHGYGDPLQKASHRHKNKANIHEKQKRAELFKYEFIYDPSPNRLPVVQSINEDIKEIDILTSFAKTSIPFNVLEKYVLNSPNSNKTFENFRALFIHLVFSYPSFSFSIYRDEDGDANHKDQCFLIKATYSKHFCNKRKMVSKEFGLTKSGISACREKIWENPCLNPRASFEVTKTMKMIREKCMDQASLSKQLIVKNASFNDLFYVKTDKTWMLPLQKMAIDQRTDISVADKEFRNLWNQFIAKHELGGRAFGKLTAPEMIQFVESNAKKLHQKDLKEKFLIHLSFLRDTQVLTKDAMEEVVTVFNRSKHS